MLVPVLAPFVGFGIEPLLALFVELAELIVELLVLPLAPVLVAPAMLTVEPAPVFARIAVLPRSAILTILTVRLALSLAVAVVPVPRSALHAVLAVFLPATRLAIVRLASAVRRTVAGKRTTAAVFVAAGPLIGVAAPTTRSAAIDIVRPTAVPAAIVVAAIPVGVIPHEPVLVAYVICGIH